MFLIILNVFFLCYKLTPFPPLILVKRDDFTTIYEGPGGLYPHVNDEWVCVDISHLRIEVPVCEI